MFKIPQDDDRYAWTYHVIEKMKHYHITPGRVKRIIRAPERVEESVVPDTVAAMQPAGTKRYQELWTMYKVEEREDRKKGNRLKIITAWRYPGKSPERDPIPDDVIREVRELLI